jgi:6-phosphogluconolactonase (cycloisomerase 2 family)
MKRFYAVLLTAFAILACSEESPDYRVDARIILLIEAEVFTQVFSPAVDLKVSEYSITGSGPGGTTFEILTQSDECIVEDLLPGLWSIQGKGFNNEQEILVEGATDFLLSSDLPEITMTMEPMAGSGAVDIIITWDSTLVQSPSLGLELIDKNGVEVDLEVNLEAGAAAAGSAINSGLFTLSVRLYDDSVLIAGAADLVYLIPDHQTTVTVPLEIYLTPLTPALSIKQEALEPRNLIITGYDPPLFTSTLAALSVISDGPPELTSENIAWFIDGVWAAAGPDLQFISSEAGTWRLDALFKGETYASGGSASLVISAYSPVHYGSLIFIESIFDNSAQNDGLSGVRSLAQVGNYLYTAGYSEDEIGIYRINQDTGKLNFISVLNANMLPDPAMLNGPASLVAIPNSDLLGVVCSVSGVLIIFQSDPASGGLIYFDSIAPRADDFTIKPSDTAPETNPLIGSVALTYLPNASMLLTVSPQQNLISSFSLDLVDGSAAPLAITSPATIAADGFDPAILSGPEGAVFSPNGSCLAVTCKSGDALLIFTVTTDGELTLRQTFRDEMDGIHGLNGAQSAAFSPDGADLYVTGYYDDAVSLFQFEDSVSEWRNTGMWQEDPENELHYPRALSVSPDGNELYVCAGGSDALTVFSRSENGTISSPVSAINGEHRVAGLDGVRALFVSENGNFVYTAASNDDAVAFLSADRP